MKDINPAPIPGHNPTGKRRPDEDTFNFRKQVLALRKEGLSYPAIGEHLGKSQGYIYKTYQKALRCIIAEDVADIRKLELERLDELQRTLNQILTTFTPLVNQGRVVSDFLDDGNGNLIKDENGEPVRVKLQDLGPKLAAIAASLKVMERRAKLLGLDAPTKTALTNPTGDKEAQLVQFYLPDNGRESNNQED